jgi:hypothetical protein
MLTITPVSSKQELNEFIRFGWKIYPSKYPHWVPPVLMDYEAKFDPKHPFYAFIEQQNFLARRNGELVGRISAIKNPRFNAEHSDKTGFFGYFECIDDQEVATALLDTAKAWLLERGLDKMHGPASPSSNYEYGLLVDGFDDEPRIDMTYNPPYYQTLIENYGFEKCMGLFAYKIDTETVTKNERIQRIAQLARNRSQVTTRPLNKSKFKEELQLVKMLYNKCWEKNYGFVTMTDEEINKMGEGLSMVAEESLIQFMFDKSGNCIGMGVALLDYNQLFHKFNGNAMNPINLVKLLWHTWFPKDKFNFARVLLLGILPEWRNKGLDAVLNFEIIKAAQALGVKHGEGSWILENNDPMNRAMLTVDGYVYKTYNVYECKI